MPRVLLPLVIAALLSASLTACGKTPAASAPPTEGLEDPFTQPVAGVLAAVTLFHGDAEERAKFEAFAEKTMKADKVKFRWQAVDDTSVRLIVFASEKQDGGDIKDYVKGLASKFKKFEGS